MLCVAATVPDAGKIMTMAIILLFVWRDNNN